MARSLVIALGLLAAACSPADNEPGPGGVSVGEARALDEAAEMIEARQLPRAQESGGPEAATPPPEGETR